MANEPLPSTFQRRVLIITHHFLGLEAPQVRYLAEYLCKKQYAVDLLGPVVKTYEPSGVRILRIAPTRLRNIMLLLRGIVLCIMCRYDLVIGVDEPGVVVALSVKWFRPKTKIALYFLDLFIDVKGSRSTRLGLQMLRKHGRAADVIIDTNEERSALRQQYAGEGPVYTVLHNVAPDQMKRLETNTKDTTIDNTSQDLRIVYTGSVHPAACLEPVIRAIGMAKAPVCLKIVGWGKEEYLQTLKNLAATCNCSQRIHFLAPVQREKLPLILSFADVGLALYRCQADAPLNERFCSPNKVYEYMAAGLPVIAGASPTMISLVQKNECGLCVASEEPTAIAAAIQHLWHRPDIRKRMGEKAMVLCRTTMNYQFQAERLFKLLDTPSTSSCCSDTVSPGRNAI